MDGSKSHWKSVTSGIPQGSVLGPIKFVIFINNLPRDVLSDVFMFANDTKIFRQISEHSDREIIQSNLNKLFDWSQTWLLKLHPDKCKVLPVSNKSITADIVEYSMKTYEGGLKTLETVEAEKDVGVNIDSNLIFANHIQNRVNKANQIVGPTRRSSVYLENRIFCLLFKALVRSLLEYARGVWTPYKKADITSIENVQKRATKMLPTLKNLTNEERLRTLKLPTLRFRRLSGDMIETFKILKGIYDRKVTEDFFESNKKVNKEAIHLRSTNKEVVLMSGNISLQTELWTYGTTLRKKSLVQNISILSRTH